MEKSKSLEIYNIISEMYPNACCELNYTNTFELVVATVLSAQTTDISVNKVTKELFKKYPTPLLLSRANYDDIIEIIKTIGLSKTKARNIINLAFEVETKYHGVVPSTFEELVTLPGVGRKTSNVVLAEAFNIPRIAVDTHVARVSYKLGFTVSNDVIKIEEDLMNLFPQELWKSVHLKLLFFGRYFCKAKNPKCNECPFKNICVKK